MRFVWTKAPEGAPTEFDGPGRGMGPLAGFTRGEIGWLKKELGVDRLQAIDEYDVGLFYYLLSIRRTDHRLVPRARWDDIALAEFRDLRHRYVEFGDGDCDDCGRQQDHPIHLPEGEPDPTPPVES